MNTIQIRIPSHLRVIRAILAATGGALYIGSVVLYDLSNTTDDISIVRIGFALLLLSSVVLYGAIQMSLIIDAEEDV